MNSSADKDRGVWEALHEFARGDFGPAGKRQPLTLHRRMRNEVILTKALQALSSSAATVPAGWKLVPVEPTRDMKKAGALALIGSATHPATSDYRADLVYGAMVKGAPVPESGRTESGWTPIQQINAAGQEGNVVAGRLRLDTGTPAEGRHSTDTESSPAPAAPSTEAPTPRTEQWAVFCAVCEKQWSVPYHHPGKSICDDCESAAKASRSASAEHDPWKEAVIDGLIVAHIYSKADEEDPRKALNKLLAWEQSVALDPRVSSAAKALVEQGRQSALTSASAARCPLGLDDTPTICSAATCASCKAWREYIVRSSSTESKDAARYRWLRERVGVRNERSMAGDTRPSLFVLVGRSYLDSAAKDSVWADALDASIDVALSATESRNNQQEK